MRPRLIALVLACIFSSGCYATRNVSVLPVVVKLDSPTGFRVVQPASGEKPASDCEALEARVDFTRIRGDTLHFARVNVTMQLPEEAPCAHGGAGYIVLTGHPDLESRRPGFEHILTAAFTVALVGVTSLVLWIAYH